MQAQTTKLKGERANQGQLFLSHLCLGYATDAPPNTKWLPSSPHHVFLLGFQLCRPRVGPRPWYCLTARSKELQTVHLVTLPKSPPGMWYKPPTRQVRSGICCLLPQICPLVLSTSVKAQYVEESVSRSRPPPSPLPPAWSQVRTRQHTRNARNLRVLQIGYPFLFARCLFIGLGRARVKTKDNRPRRELGCGAAPEEKGPVLLHRGNSRQEPELRSSEAPQVARPPGQGQPWGPPP